MTVLDASVTASGVPFLVTELLRGRTLAAELQRHGPMSSARCAEILLPICNVLAEAHTLGIVHRDIKPQNIYLHRSRQGEMVKVLDFGIAKLIDEAVVRRRSAAGSAGPGTPAYMAPERFSSGYPCDGRADIYSLGVMLYNMLVGRLPFTVEGGNLIKLGDEASGPKPRRLRASLDGLVRRVWRPWCCGRSRKIPRRGRAPATWAAAFGARWGSKCSRPRSSFAAWPRSRARTPSVKLSRSTRARWTGR